MLIFILMKQRKKKNLLLSVTDYGTKNVFKLEKKKKNSPWKQTFWIVFLFILFSSQREYSEHTWFPFPLITAFNSFNP